MVDYWHLQVSGYRENAPQEKSGMHRVHSCTTDDWLVFPVSHPTSNTDKLPFKKPKNFTLSFKLSIFTFVLFFGHHLLFLHIFTKLKKQQIIQNLNTTEGVSELTELCNTHTENKLKLPLKFLSFFYGTEV
jgi:hypothetical protein